MKNSRAAGSRAGAQKVDLQWASQYGWPEKKDIHWKIMDLDILGPRVRSGAQKINLECALVRVARMLRFPLENA